MYLFGQARDLLGDPSVAAVGDVRPVPARCLVADRFGYPIRVVERDGVAPTDYVGREPVRFVEALALYFLWSPADREEQLFAQLEAAVRAQPNDRDVDIRGWRGGTSRVAAD